VIGTKFEADLPNDFRVKVSYPVPSGHLFIGVIGMKFEADLPNDFSVKIKNVWIFTSTSPPNLFHSVVPQHFKPYVYKVKTIPDGSSRLRLPDFGTVGTRRL
jgi:hypothetical protein